MSRSSSVLRLLVGAALLGYLFYEHEVPLGGVLGHVAALPLWALGGAIVLDLAGQSLSAYRWSAVVRLGGRELRFWEAWPLYFSGMFFNICLPTSIGGDLIRAIGLGRRLQSRTSALATVFMDRNIGMAALLTLGTTCACLWASASIEATFFGVRLPVPLWPLFLLLWAGYLAVNAVLWNPRPFRFLERVVLARLPDALRLKGVKLHEALQSFRLPLGRFTQPYLLSLLYQVMESASVLLLAWGLGVRLPFWVFGALVTFQAVAGMLPITINNIGVREGIFCAVLLGQATNLGLAPEVLREKALALALCYFGLIVFSGLCGGLVYLRSGLPAPAALKDDGAMGSCEPVAERYEREGRVVATASRSGLRARSRAVPGP